MYNILRKTSSCVSSLYEQKAFRQNKVTELKEDHLSQLCDYKTEAAFTAECAAGLRSLQSLRC